MAEFYVLQQDHKEKEMSFVQYSIPEAIDSRKTEDNISNDGKSLAEIIQGPESLIFHAEHSQNPTDFPISVSGHKIVSEKFKTVLESIVTDEVEFFEVQLFGPVANKNITQKYYLMNLVKVCSAMDYEKSEYFQLSNGFVEEIDHFVVDHTKVENEKIFRLGEVLHVLIVNDETKETIEAASISGVKFKPLEGYAYPF
mgnify:CR=1 FL=1